MTRLQLQLRDAAERQARAGAPARLLRDARWRLRSPLLAGAMAAALFAVAAVAGVLALRGEDPPPAGPVVVARLDITPNPFQLEPAFGALWVTDNVAGDVVRVDPADRRVVARIPVKSGSFLLVTPVGEQLWATDTAASRLWRIDPATDAVVGRIALRTPDGRPFVPASVLASDRAVWAVNAGGVLRLDPSTGKALRYVSTSTAAGEAEFFALGEDAFWMLHTDNSLRRLDPLTGAETASIRPAIHPSTAMIPLGDDLIVADRGTVARLDGATGAAVWQRTVGDGANGADVADGVLWVHSSAARVPDRLTALSLEDGSTVSSTALTTFGSTGVRVIGPEVWVATPAGETLVLRR